MFVACSTLCFGKLSLEAALRHMADLEFTKIELALVESGDQLRPSEVAENPDAALHKIRHGPSLTPSSLFLDFGEVDERTLRRRYEAMCRLAKALTVAVLAIPAAPANSSFDQEVRRLGELTEIAHREGLVLTVLTESGTLTGDPASTLALCKAVPGLALTFDPSPFLNGPAAGVSFDELLPYAQNVHFRDTGKRAGEFQVRVGQGQVEYGRIINLLERSGYDRGLNVAIFDGIDNPFDSEVEVRKLKLLLESLI